MNTSCESCGAKHDADLDDCPECERRGVGESCAELVKVYRDAVAKLNDYRARIFRPGCFVKVNCDRFRGFGFVVRCSDCPPHLLPVCLENGNTWWYPLESAEPVFDLLSVPRSVRRRRLRGRGYKLTGCAR